MTRKAPKHPALKVKNAVSDNKVKSLWDPSKTPHENLNTMGLDPDPNRSKEAKPRKDKTTAFVGFMEIQPNGVIDPNPKRNIISEMDQKYIASCLKRHGEDYEKMAKDIKRNNRQLTENQLRTMAKKFFAVDEKHRAVEIPDNIKSHIIV